MSITRTRKEIIQDLSIWLKISNPYQKKIRIQIFINLKNFSGKMKKRLKLNRPYPSTRKNKKMMVLVLNPKTKRINRIHFGQKGYKHNYSKRAWKNYMRRSSGITDGRGRKTKNNRLSANYWARRVLWSGRKWRR